MEIYNRMLDESDRGGVKPDSETCNTIIASAADADMLDVALGAHEHMIAHHLERDEVCCQFFTFKVQAQHSRHFFIWVETRRLLGLIRSSSKSTFFGVMSTLLWGASQPATSKGACRLPRCHSNLSAGDNLATMALLAIGMPGWYTITWLP
jgi:hypothetical protein